MKLPLALAFAFTALLRLSASPIEADLGDGLRYHRAHALPAELPSPAGKPFPLVLDLRYATADQAAATALDAWVKFRAAPATPIIVLVNAETAGELRGVFAANGSQPGFVTVGMASPDYSPDIAVATTPEAERQAYDVLEHNGSLAASLTENADKPRTDEAAVMRDRAHSPEELTDLEFDEFAPPATAKETTPPPPPIDASLRRAVQLHRALRALKRIP